MLPAMHVIGGVAIARVDPSDLAGLTVGLLLCLVGRRHSPPGARAECRFRRQGKQFSASNCSRDPTKGSCDV